LRGTRVGLSAVIRAQRLAAGGQVIDVLLALHRDAVAARRFVARALRTLTVIPSQVVTDAGRNISACSTSWCPRRDTTSSSTSTFG